MGAAERAGKRLAMPANGFDEVGKLSFQRLGQFDFGADDIAIAHQEFELAEGAGMRLADGDAFFVNAHALHAIEVVEDEALAAAYRRLLHALYWDPPSLREYCR